MGTPFGTDERISRFSNLAESLTLELIQILTENYNAGKLSLGNNMTDNFYEKEVFYTLTDSELENDFLTFKYKNTEFGSPYEIIIESTGIDSPTELKIQVDENLVNKLPDKMIKELTDRFYKLIFN
ncbi:hypothetical protein [Tenacibaculum amylolyticum]|uniref:hypothetical protein n=1 Tax=Tenacibaculum amylolyticum TaxID=104269 RepID=UPI00389427B1